MSVYVDDAIWEFGHMKMCHMIADTPEELHAMAASLGLKRAWFQNKGRVHHYDVSKGKRTIAIKLGAVALERRPYVDKMNQLFPRSPVQRLVDDAIDGAP